MLDKTNAMRSRALCQGGNLKTIVGVITLLMAIMLLGGCAAPTDESSPSNDDSNVTQTDKGNTDGNADGNAPKPSDVASQQDKDADRFRAIWRMDSMEMRIEDKPVGTWDKAAIDKYEQLAEFICHIDMAMDTRELEDTESRACYVGIIGLDAFAAYTTQDSTTATLTLAVPLAEDVTDADLPENSILQFQLSLQDDDTLKMHGESPSSLITISATFHRFSGSKEDLQETLSQYIQANEETFNSLPIEVDLGHKVLSDDEFCTIELVGTTHNKKDNSIGYLLDITNKTDQNLILNQYATDNEPFFVGDKEIPVNYMRAIPTNFAPDPENPEARIYNPVPVRVYLSFDKDALENSLSGITGTILLTDYNWYPYSSYNLKF